MQIIQIPVRTFRTRSAAHTGGTGWQHDTVTHVYLDNYIGAPSVVRPVRIVFCHFLKVTLTERLSVLPTR